MRRPPRSTPTCVCAGAFLSTASRNPRVWSSVSKTMNVTLWLGSSRSSAQKPRTKPGFCLTPSTSIGRTCSCCSSFIAASIVQVPATAYKWRPLSHVGDLQLRGVVGDVDAVDDQVDVGVALLVGAGEGGRGVAVHLQRPRVDDRVAEVDLRGGLDRGDLGDVRRTGGAAEVAAVEVVDRAADALLDVDRLAVVRQVAVSVEGVGAGGLEHRQAEPGVRMVGGEVGDGVVAGGVVVAEQR